jgi:hypothetical protein
VSALRVETHPEATAVATSTTQNLLVLPQSFFARPAEQVAPELIGCLLVKRQPDDELLRGMIMSTMAFVPIIEIAQRAPRITREAQRPYQKRVLEFSLILQTR